MKPFAHRKVLVLNKNFTAIGVVTLERAIVMLWSSDAKGAPKAEIINRDSTPMTWKEWARIRPEEGDDVIHTCQGKILNPEIIKLNRYEKLPHQKVHFSRKTIYERDERKCCFCRKKHVPGELSIDHIVPRSKGGLTEWTNCCLACVYCNKCKDDRMPTKHVDKDGTLYTVYFQDGKKKWQVIIDQPTKPKYNFFRTAIHYESWKAWLDEMYWNIELENDNKE